MRCLAGFPGEMVGASGILDDGSSLFFTDECNRHTYRLSESGGAVSSGLDVANGLDGFLIRVGTHYYGLGGRTGGLAGGPGLYEFDPNTLAVAGGGSSPVVSVVNPTNVAVDPQTGDLFIGSGNNGIERIHGLPGAPTVTTFVAPSGDFIGSVSFNSDGSILYASNRINFPNTRVVGYDRTAVKVFDQVDTGGGGDGLAVAPPQTVVNGVTVSNNIFVNNNGTNGTMPSTYGNIGRYDTNNSNAFSTVASGGTRGDIVAIDCQGYLLVTQTDRIVRMAPAFFTKPPWCSATTTTTTTVPTTSTTLVTTLPPSACPDAPAAAAIEAMVEAQCHCSTASNHGKFVRCAKHVAKGAVTLPKSCKRAVADCAARSTCGKPGFVTCCRTTANGKTTCSLRSDAAHCRPTKHGTSCTGQRPSCCDACIAGGCAAP